MKFSPSVLAIGLGAFLPSVFGENNNKFYLRQGKLPFKSGRMLDVVYDDCNDGTREGACRDPAAQDCTLDNLPAGVIEHWLTSANINCFDLGFDFGYKTGDPGCFDETNREFKDSSPNIEATEARNCNTNWDCSLPSDANYSVQCSNPDGSTGGQFKTAVVNSNIDMYIYVKAQEGYLFDYQAGTDLTVFAPDQKDISHIEFCFLCPRESEAPSISPSKAPTESPSANPTPAPSDAPTPAPSDNPTPAPSKVPTPSPSNYPTESPSANPTDAPSDNPTPAPSKVPTPSPSNYPTESPSGAPSKVPTPAPSAVPTPSPSNAPTSAPSNGPTASPSSAPTEPSCETSFAYAPNPLGQCFITDSTYGPFKRWGWTIGPLDSPTTASYTVYAGAGICDITKGTDIGTFEVIYDGTTVTGTFVAHAGFTFLESHFYAGSHPYPLDNGKETVAPGQYTVVNDNEVRTAENQVLSVTLDSADANGPIYIIGHIVSCENTALTNNDETTYS